MVKAKTFNQLFGKIQNDIANKLYFSSNIQDKIAEIMHEKTKEKVYDVYDPKVYIRRENDGGLLDIDNMEFTDVNIQGNSVVFTFQNTTPASSDELLDLAPIIEHGTGGDAPYEKPREFNKATIEELNSSSKGELVNAFKKDLRNIGYKIK